MIYRNYPILPAVPDGDADPSTTFTRSVSVLASAAGIRKVLDKSGRPVLTREFNWSCFGAGAIDVMRSFLVSCKGRLEAFWLPSFTRDLTLTQPAGAGALTLTVQQCGYVAYVFALGNSRRHFAYLDAAGVVFAVKITAAAATAGGEVLTLANPLPAALPAGAALSYLALVRMDTDTTAISYTSLGVAAATLQLTELPGETP